jgi:hypothetical protein
MKLSGSSLQRASICPPSAILPAVQQVAAAATRGTVWHDFLFRVNTEGLQRALEAAPAEHRAALAALDFDRLPLNPDAWAPEVSFAYNVESDTARELGRGLGRDYGPLLLEGELPGTPDVTGVHLVEDKRARVLDYKTGFAHLGAPAESWQLGFYALCAARAMGAEEAEVSFIRIREDGEAYFDTAVLDFFALEAIALRLREVVARVREAQATHEAGGALALTEGEHCRRCPALPRCPAMATLATALGSGEGWLTPGELTPERAARVWERLQAARLVVERVTGALELYASEAPIPLPGGRVYGVKKLPRDVFDARKAAPVLEQIFGAQFATKAIDTTPSLTKEGMRRALRAEAQTHRGLKVEPSLRHLLEQLREAGALHTRYSYPVMAYKPRPEEAEDERRPDGVGGLPGGAACEADSKGGGAEG